MVEVVSLCHLSHVSVVGRTFASRPTWYWKDTAGQGRGNRVLIEFSQVIIIFFQLVIRSYLGVQKVMLFENVQTCQSAELTDV